MAVAATTSTSVVNTSTASTSNTAATQSFLANYDTFLQLLTTQLRVQNPLEPMDAEKFTEQLVQYSAVEQQLKTNENLEAMLATLVSNAALNLVNFIGKTVEANSDIAMLKDGNATWKVSAAGDAPNTTVTIRNEAGAIVFQEEIELDSGANTYEWDGKMSNGSSVPEGAYQISFDAADANDATVAVTTRVSGTVTAVDTSGSEPYLKINGSLIPLSNLISIGE